jgi:hypothetical protein
MLMDCGSWDPKRDEFNNFDPFSDDEKKRAHIAKRLRGLRQLFRSPDGSWVRCTRSSSVGIRIFSNDEIRSMVSLHSHYKVTAENLRELARAQWNWVEEPIRLGIPCGTDDAIGENKDYARSHALAIWRLVGRF